MTRLWERKNCKLANNEYKMRLSPILQPSIKILSKCSCFRRHEISPFTATVCRHLTSVIVYTFFTNLSRDLTNIDWLLQSHGPIICFNWFINPTFFLAFNIYSIVTSVTTLHYVTIARHNLIVMKYWVFASPFVVPNLVVMSISDVIVSKLVQCNLQKLQKMIEALKLPITRLAYMALLSYQLMYLLKLSAVASTDEPLTSMYGCFWQILPIYARMLVWWLADLYVDFSDFNVASPC